jgi:hypothetical protein
VDVKSPSRAAGLGLGCWPGFLERVFDRPDDTLIAENEEIWLVNESA